MTQTFSGLTSWQNATNHNRMIEHQRRTDQGSPLDSGNVQLTYFGSSAFQIESPGGITVMVDPWRNHPSRRWDWYFADFPHTQVDIGVSTHAHFDHDALHRLDASVLLDRLIGSFRFGDLQITGIADKHATDASAALYDFKRIIKAFDGIDISPPDNPRSWDNCLITLETGGLRVLHWGDNRHNPPQEIWQQLGLIDVLLIPVDDSQHVLGFNAIEAIIQRVSPALVIPHHYYIWDVVQRQSTLQLPDRWLAGQSNVIVSAGSASQNLTPLVKESRESRQCRVLYFGDQVGFDATAWRESQ